MLLRSQGCCCCCGGGFVTTDVQGGRRAVTRVPAQPIDSRPLHLLSLGDGSTLKPAGAPVGAREHVTPLLQLPHNNNNSNQEG